MFAQISMLMCRFVELQTYIALVENLQVDICIYKHISS